MTEHGDGGPVGMRWVPPGEFTMGSDHDYREERPAHRERVDGFWMDVAPVTVAEFGRFVAATGYLTTAEQTPDAADYPDADPALLVAGSLVFTPPPGPVPLDDPARWWSYVPGACWRRPEGPGSTVDGLAEHPVVHVSLTDARTYARWAGKELATEAQWERAARGGRDGRRYAWGEELMPAGVPVANTWQGDFPWRSDDPDGFSRTSPVGHYPANPYGLVDLIGNVWEWTASAATDSHGSSPSSCCAPNPARDEAAAHPRNTIKGGSHLCAPEYCRRYRPAARAAQEVDGSTSHLGFRCVSSDSEIAKQV